jgi:hypothetical protein
VKSKVDKELAIKHDRSDKKALAHHPFEDPETRPFTIVHIYIGIEPGRVLGITAPIGIEYAPAAGSYRPLLEL